MSHYSWCKVKQSEHKYWRFPLRIISLSSFFVFEHSKCSKSPHLDHFPTANLLLRFNQLYLQDMDAHFMSTDSGVLEAHVLKVFDFLFSTLSKSSWTILFITASNISFSLYFLCLKALWHHGRKNTSTKYFGTARFPRCTRKQGFSPKGCIINLQVVA